MNEKLISLAKNGMRVLLVGPPGCAKTARVAAAATACGMDTVTFRASLSERIDFSGCLVPDHIAGVTRALPLEPLKKLQETNRPTILFLDDLGQAPFDVQAALMKLFEPGFLPENVVIWGATNRPADKAGVYGLCEPIRSRFNLAFNIPTSSADVTDVNAVYLGNYKDEVTNWCEWMEKTYPKAIDVSIWHRAPQHGVALAVGPVLYGWAPTSDPSIRVPDYRTWEVVAQLISKGIDTPDNLGAAIGKGQAVAFDAFRKTSEKIHPEDILKNPKDIELPKTPGANVLVAIRLASYLVKENLKDNIKAYIQYIDRLDRVYGALSAREIFKRLANDLNKLPDWKKWVLDNKVMFSIN